MKTWADGTYSATYGYDDLSRVLTIDSVYPIGTKTVSYTYDSFGNRETLTYPDSIETLTYIYDDLERLQEIKDLALNTTQYDYDNANRLEKKTLPNGVYTDYGYDNANRLTSLTNKKSDTTTILSSYSYTHDNIGNRLTKSALEGIHNYVYDDIYRLKSADHPVLTDEAYTYDNVGNRKTSVEYDNWNHDNNNRLTDNNGYIYAHDDNGNMTTKTEILTSDQTIYQYDYENRLKRIDYQGGTYSEYEYDPFGNRIKKDNNGTIIWYVNDSISSLPDVIAEYNNSGAVTVSYTHGQGMDEMISLTVAGNNYYYQKDGVGSVVSITDNSETEVNTYRYDAFGKVVNSTGTITNSYGYTGRRYDTESGLMYYRARYYDPAAGRFISADPIGFAGGDVNFYAYVGNNPINLRDPYGLLVFPGPTGFIGGGIVGAITGTITGAITGAEGGVVGAIGGAIGGGAAGFVSGAIGGAITGTFGGGTIAGVVGGTIGTFIGEMFSPTTMDFSDLPPEPFLYPPLPPGDYPLPLPDTLPC